MAVPACHRVALLLAFVASTFAWLAAPASAASSGSAFEQAVSRLGLNRSDYADVTQTDRYTDADTGVTHLYLRQRYRGLDVLNGTMSLSTRRDGALLHVGDRFVRGLAAKAADAAPTRTAAAARDEANRQLAHGPVLSAGPKARLVYYATASGQLRPAWSMRVVPASGRHVWDVAVDARTLDVLHAADWVADNGSYRVLAPPLASPLLGSRTLVSDPDDPVASPFGWHDTNGAEGPETTLTSGNNVDAGTDVNHNNAIDPGSQPDGGSGLVFDFPLDLTLAPDANTAAGVTNAFFWTNYLHDVAYRLGFTEVAGNFQANNYGRGGVAGDQLEAESQDGLTLNNANMATPPDGEQPRLQMFNWTQPNARTALVTVDSPAGIAGDKVTTRADFGPDTDANGVAGSVAVVDDGAAPTSDGCQAPAGGSLAGLLALVDRGNCTFETKVKNAEAAGATGVIVVQTEAVGSASVMGADPAQADPTIASAMISFADGAAIKNTLALGDAVQATLKVTTPPTPPDRDSALDSGIVTHEYTHGITSRLTGGPANASCLDAAESAGMNEGWSDYVALELTHPPDATATTALNVFPYATFGQEIRPSDYTTDMDVDNATYDSLATQSEAHNVGWIWASMLWDLRWKLGGGDTTLRLVIDAEKLQPCNPGFVDARDALLAADNARFAGAHSCAIWQAFARRGLGVDATQGDVNDLTDGTSSTSVGDHCTPPPQPPATGGEQTPTATTTTPTDTGTTPTPAPPPAATPARTLTIKISAPKKLKLGALLAGPRTVTGFSGIRYQWLRSGRAIRGATKRTYKLQRADLGKRIALRVTLTGPDGNSTVTSGALKVPSAPKRRSRG